MKNNYLENTKVQMKHGYERLHSDIIDIENELKRSVEQIRSDKYMISSISLVNNYQDKQNYNSILLDEEKKIIANMLLNKVKLSLNNDIAIYDKNGDLISYVIKKDEVYKMYFISYDENASMVLYEKNDTDNEYKKTKLKEYKLMPFHHVAFYKVKDVQEKSTVTYHVANNELYLKSHYSVHNNGSKNLHSHMEISYKIGEKYLKKISNDIKIDVSFVDNIDQSKGHNLLGALDFNNIPVEQTQDSFYSIFKIKTDSDDERYVHLMLKLDKDMLQKALTESRFQFLIIMLIVAVVSITVLQMIFRKRLFKPLEKVMCQINKIENRDYTPSSTVNTHDELGLISKNINNLATTINKRESELLESKKNLTFLSEHDSLTSLPNRRLFIDRLHHALYHAKRDKTMLAVAFLDLDQFKQVNDTLGHDIGDTLLQAVANRLKTLMRSVDTVARIGGDEFNILFEGIKHKNDLEVIMTKLVGAFQLPFDCNGHEISSTASIGISVYPDDGDDTMVLLKNADLAMYKTKNEGRNSFSFFTNELSSYIENRTTMLNALKNAIKDYEEFSVVYQPKVSIETGKVAGVEALVRWNSSSMGAIRPDQFISLAEESHMIIPLGEWIARKACEDFMNLQKEGFDIGHLSINISSIQLLYSDMLSTIKNVMQTTGIEAKKLEIEITESYIATDEKSTLEMLNKFRDMGIFLAIDDFGTGYSSLSYIQQLPVTRLKIDKSFVDELPHSSKSVGVAKAIIALAKTFNIQLTAEGVENEKQKEFLRENGCDEIQGYFYSKPLSIDDLKKYLL
ncbi:putative bifunctional diguanylate cyclase/phosphodiesterase [Sulfurimonas sp.]|uniref:putative bifunctional diguanylate cyclase/phosphodiesterase n=1 Tax=Sulfurimonas sp. TaxID=2022749 RepID=UPI0035689D68